jgi:hypothetical protein
VTVPGPGTVPLFSVPPGLVNVSFWSLSSPSVFVGTSPAVSPASGMVCHSIPTSLFSYIASKGVTFYGANTAASSATIAYLAVSPA